MDFLNFQTFDNYIEANLVLNRYLSEGIDCYLKDENTVTLDPVFTQAIGGIKLCVREDYITKAQALYQQIKHETKTIVVCSNCGSSEVQYVNQNTPSNWLYAIFGSFFGSFALKGKHVYKCFDCKNEFETIVNKNLEEC
jgi:DNA-directed RNA polymerase subunit RPC12/RpoP